MGLTQSTAYHTSLPPGIETEEVVIKGEPGVYIPFDALAVKGFVSFTRSGIYINLGGNGSKEQILAWAEALNQGGM